MPSSRKELVFALAAVCLGLVASLVLLELGLRIFWDGFYLKGGPESFSRRPHATRAFENRPSVKLRRGEAEFAMDVTHNALGFRGPEVRTEKQPGRPRILALGDSFTYGVGVDDDETFCAELAKLDPRLEVINTGVNAYGTAQELRVLEEIGLSLEPDVVLVSVYWNDLGGARVGYSLADGELHFTKPALERTHPKADNNVSRVMRHSYAYRFISDRQKIAKYKIRYYLGKEKEPYLLSEEQTAEAWTFHLAVLEEIAGRSRQHGANILVVVIPDQVQVHPERDASVIGLDPHHYEMQERLVAFGEERGIPVLDLLPGLQQAAKGLDEELYYEKDRHFVAEGHRITARLIHAELRRLRFID